MIKILFFDAAGTLFTLPRGVGWHYREVAARHGCTLEESLLQSAFRSVWAEMPARPATLVPRADDDRGWWRELVGRVLDRCAVRPAELDRDAYFAELYHEFTKPGIWTLFPEVRSVLEELRPQFRIGLISNFDGRLRPILGHLELGGFFEPLIISSEVGADKPHPWIFQEAVRRAGVSPAEALHIGDDPERDWKGAAEAGLHVFQLDRPRTSLRDLAEFLKGPAAS